MIQGKCIYYLNVSEYIFDVNKNMVGYILQNIRLFLEDKWKRIINVNINVNVNANVNVNVNANVNVNVNVYVNAYVNVM